MNGASLCLLTPQAGSSMYVSCRKLWYLHIHNPAGDNSSSSTTLIFFRFPSELTVLKRHCHEGLHGGKVLYLGSRKGNEIKCLIIFPMAKHILGWNLTGITPSPSPSKLWVDVHLSGLRMYTDDFFFFKANLLEISGGKLGFLFGSWIF